MTTTKAFVAESSKVELKAGAFTLLKLCMPELDADAIDSLLCERIAKAPEFFRNTPIVIDLTQSDVKMEESDLAVAVGAIRGYGLIPVGVRGGSKAFQEQAKLLELAVFSDARRAAKKESPKKPRTTPSSMPVATKVVDTPVRSGQRVYAQGDLVLLAPVSSGAEVVANGSIHAYTSIRGRVLAGVRGDEQAAIFCKDLRAELVSIAGRYKVSEDLEARFMGRLVRVTLLGDALVFNKL
ncbi:MAG: septum site-determining protein MinC [Candidatus Thiodiazotropha taylori]|nr:septum site-determining protein MinC [Candidatus Thiodiazotropha taylori]MCG7959876.1 septum site-determining protein MinC [Candidatus Thiodiazotropha taylori]MCG8071108.1 septum site-determining protein MinC [Candidatus Thiodiazotropha taylori]MCG8086761.1 septum site-determining protein MinC [Candidatus Thiodiazotropha taylori]MCW4233441.1 septum site-determining protein MinC [Candidatus Thiodiazotropha taylori]